MVLRKNINKWNDINNNGIIIKVMKEIKWDKWNDINDNRIIINKKMKVLKWYEMIIIMVDYYWNNEMKIKE